MNDDLIKAAELLALRTRLKSGEYDGTDIMKAWIAIDELRAALAEARLSAPKQELVKYLVEAEWPDRFGCPLEVIYVTDLGNGKVGIRVKPHESRAELLSAPQPPAQPVNEPANDNRVFSGDHIHVKDGQYFHTRTEKMLCLVGESAKPLTEEQIAEIPELWDVNFDLVIPIVRAVEAAHGIVQQEGL